MGEQQPQWIVPAAIGIMAGLALGAFIGWWAWPVTYTNTSPAALREDYRDEYVLMVAAAYQVQGDAAQARERLALLDPQQPSAAVVELAERLVERGGREEDIERLVHLAQALGVMNPTLTPYLAS
jgi:hypothetical protein